MVRNRPKKNGTKQDRHSSAHEIVIEDQFHGEWNFTCYEFLMQYTQIYRESTLIEKERNPDIVCF